MNRRLFIAGAALAPVAVRAATSLPAPIVTFDFRSNFWLNLHHRLYRTAGIAAAAASGRHISVPAKAMLNATAGLSTADQAVWHDALAVYSKVYTSRDLLFDDQMTAIKESLSRMTIGESPVDEAIPPDLRGALSQTRDIYRVSLWNDDDAMNAQWIESAQRLVARFGTSIGARLATIWQSPWPIGPYRVDVCRYANYLGAYTTTGPIHIVVASGDPGNRGNAALEVLYHEASHAVVFPDAGTVGTAIEDGATIAGATEPENLWHAVIFYTLGSVVAEALSRDQLPAYTPYADANGVYDNGWENYPRALKKCWQPYVDRGGSLERSLVATVRLLAKEARTGNPV